MLSADRQSNWIHLIVTELVNSGLVDCTNKVQMVRSTHRAMDQFMIEYNQIEKRVRQKIASLKRNVSENSSEWGVLFFRYYEEELSRSHLANRK